MPAKDLPTSNKDYPSTFSVRLNKKEQKCAAGQPHKTKSLEKYKTTQLELPFVLPLKHRGQYSRTINLYDAIPKYFWGRIKQKDRISGKFLNTEVRTFVFENVQYTVKIVPARIEVAKGNEIDKFPGRREELVERNHICELWAARPQGLVKDR